MRILGKLSFAFLLYFCLMGLSIAIPAVHASPAGIQLSVRMLAVPQSGSAPTFQPNGTPHQANLSWTASTPVTGVTVAGYNVYRATTAGGESGAAINGTTLITGTSYIDATVVSGSTYFYKVEAQSSTGNQSVPSNEASGTVPQNPSGPTGCNAAMQ